MATALAVIKNERGWIATRMRKRRRVAALAVDGTTSARTTGTPANNVDVTTASFTPASNSLLAVLVTADTGASNGITISVSNSTGLTWTQVIARDFVATGNPGHASVWYANVVTGTSMTVSVRRTAGLGGTNRISFMTYLVTGQNVASPIGNSGGGTSTTNNITPTAYTSSVNNSVGIGCATDWNANGVPTSTDTANGADYATAISVISVYKAAATPTSGTTVTLNFNAGGAGAAVWNWVGMELKPA